MSTSELHSLRMARYASRKRVNGLAIVLAMLAMMFGLVWLFWILFETIRLGIGGLTFATLTQMTPPPNEEGGLANAIYGSIVMVGLATLVGAPVGIMAGIYLAEFEKNAQANGIKIHWAIDAEEHNDCQPFCNCAC